MDEIIQAANIARAQKIIGGFEVQCDTCQHLAADGARCDAFPEGIPADIFVGVHDHREPYPSDRGIGFEACAA